LGNQVDCFFGVPVSVNSAKVKTGQRYVERTLRNEVLLLYGVWWCKVFLPCRVNPMQTASGRSREYLIFTFSGLFNHDYTNNREMVAIPIILKFLMGFCTEKLLTQKPGGINYCNQKNL